MVSMAGVKVGHQRYRGISTCIKYRSRKKKKKKKEKRLSSRSNRFLRSERSRFTGISKYGIQLCNNAMLDRAVALIASRPCEIDLSISFFFVCWRKQLAGLLPQGSFFNLISAAKGRQ